MCQLSLLNTCQSCTLLHVQACNNSVEFKLNPRRTCQENENINFTLLTLLWPWNKDKVSKPGMNKHSSVEVAISTFSQCVAHYGTTQNFSPHTASATGEWQALRHSWMRCTLVYSTNPKNDTAELLKVDIITANLQLMVSTTTRSEKLWPSILDSSPISVWTKAPSAGISHATFGFLLHYQNIHELLELFTQSKLRDTDSAGDAEE